MSHRSHVTNCMVIVEMTSTLSQCDAVLPVLQLVSLTSCFNPLQILSVDNEIQFHQLHHLNEPYQLKGPAFSQLYCTVSKSNDMQFHHLISLVAPLERVVPVERTPSLTALPDCNSNDMQFHHLNESYQLKGPPSSQLYCTVSKSNDMQFHHLISPVAPLVRLVRAD